MKRLVIGFIRLYQVLTGPLVSQGVLPWSLSGCRSWPTCSNYSILMIDQHGIVRGGYKSMIRLLRCHPLHAVQ